MRRLRSWLVGLGLPVLAGAWLLFGLHGMEAESPVGPEAPPAPRYSLKGVQWTRLNAQGQREFTADADTADYFDDESAVYEQLRMKVPGIHSAPWQLSSPKGYAPAHEKRISMQNPVDIVGAWPDGEPLTMQTPQLWVDPVDHQINTQAGVVFNSATRNGSAQNLNADWARQTVELLGNVSMRYAPARH